MRKSTTHPRHELRAFDDPADRKSNGRTGFPIFSRLIHEQANAAVAGCRVPMPSKGKQKIGTLPSGEPSIECNNLAAISGIAGIDKREMLSWLRFQLRSWCSSPNLLSNEFRQNHQREAGTSELGRIFVYLTQSLVSSARAQAPFKTVRRGLYH